MVAVANCTFLPWFQSSILSVVTQYHIKVFLPQYHCCKLISWSDAVVMWYLMVDQTFCKPLHNVVAEALQAEANLYQKYVFILSLFSFTRSVTFLTSLSWNITQVISLVARMKCERRWKEHTLSYKGGFLHCLQTRKEISGLHGKEWPSSTCSQDSGQSVDSRLSGASIQIFPSHVSKFPFFPSHSP